MSSEDKNWREFGSGFGDGDYLLHRIAPELRRARPQDAEALAPMFLGIWQSMHFAPPWDEGLSLRALTSSVGTGRGRFRWQNDIVWEEEGEVQGVVCFYPGEEEAKLNQDFLPCLAQEGVDTSGMRFAPESKAGELYLDALYTLPEIRGQGVGSDLLRACMVLTASGTAPLVLNVDRRNPRALQLYRRMGFVTFESRELMGSVYDTMRYTPLQARRDFNYILA